MAMKKRETTATPIRFLRRSAVMDCTGLGSTLIDEKEAAGEFPRRFPIGQRAVAWLESEVTEWQKARIEEARA